MAGGVYAPTPEALRTVRGYIERSPQKAESLLGEPQLLHHFGGLRTEGNLKRFPRGYTQGPELLKYKSFTVGTGLPELDADGLRALTLAHFAAMQPLHAYLRDALAYRASPKPGAGLSGT